MTPPTIRLRYPGKCAVCAKELPAGSHAHWDKTRKAATCDACLPSDQPTSAEAWAAPSDVAGASAVAEAARRRAKQAERLQAEREARPILGRIRQAVAPEPDHGKSWAKGGEGEQWLGAKLDADAKAGLTIPLHDRLRPRSRANIDHLIVGPNGVWVVDAKDYRGTVRLEDKGSFFKADLRLTVNGRDRSKLAEAVGKQVIDVEAAIAAGPRPDAPVHGALCFVSGEFGLRMRPFSLSGILVAWPKLIRKRVQEEGPLDEDGRRLVAQHLDGWFKPAA